MVIRFETTSVEKGKVKKRRIFRFIVTEIAEAKIPLSIIPFLSIYLFVNKAKIPWCIIIIGNSYRSSFLINKAKMHPSSTIPRILRLPFIPRINRVSFHRPKNKNSTEKRFPVSPIKYRSIFFSFFLLSLSTNRYIESPMVNTNRGWITLACESWSKRIARFQGNWYRLRAINNASTRRQTEAELEISGLASANSLTGTTHMSTTICEQHPGKDIPPVTHEFGRSPSLDWFRGRVPSYLTWSISSTRVFRGINVSIYWPLESPKVVKCLIR